jgi:hypothetical protein
MFKFVFIFLACLPFLGFAQEPKDSEIIVVPRDTANVYSQVANLLKTEGYTLWLDTKTTILTKQKTMGRGGGIGTVYKFRITPDNTILVSGDVLMNLFNPELAGYEELYYDDRKRALRKEPWQEMDRLAKLLGTVTYSKKRKN